MTGEGRAVGRRRVLQSLGAIGATSLTGCTGDEGQGNGDGRNGAGEDGGGGTENDIAEGEADENAYRNPMYEPLFPDPTVVRADDAFYAYGSHMDKEEDDREELVPILRSSDLVEWTKVGEVFSSLPDWKEDSSLWAPNIVRHDGQYHLYYSYSVWGSNENPGIGLATADEPGGPFTDHGPVFREADLGMTNCIDPYFTVVDGTPYMVWGSWFGLYGVEMTEDGRDYVEGTDVHLAGDHREGPLIIEREGYYYLFYSTGLCCEGLDSTYSVEVGRSESFTGPYFNQEETDLRDLDDHNEGVAILSGNDRFVGPGHGTAIRDDADDWWLLYHAYDTRDGGYVDGTWRRVLVLDRIRWDEDGWPVVANGTPSMETTAPEISD